MAAIFHSFFNAFLYTFLLFLLEELTDRKRNPTKNYCKHLRKLLLRNTYVVKFHPDPSANHDKHFCCEGTFLL